MADLPGFYFCLCPDATLLREQVNSLEALLAAGAPSCERLTFWGDEGLLPSFWEHLNIEGLVPSAKLLWVRSAQLLPAETWKKLSSQLATPRAHVLPVFSLESPWEKGQPKLPAHVAKLKCLAFAEKQQWLWKNAGLDSRTLRRYIQDQTKKRALNLAADALEALCQFLPPDAASVGNALDQLQLAAGSAPVQVNMVRQLAKHNPELVIFDFIRYLQQGNAEAVWQTLLSEGEELLFPLLSLLGREVRILWQLLAGEDVSLPPSIVGSKKQLATRLGFPALSHILEALMEAEWTVKSGRRQPQQALEALVASLLLIFAPQCGRSSL